MGLAALDHRDVRTMRMQLLRDVMAAGPSSEHQCLASLPLPGVPEFARVHLGTGKRTKAGQIWRVRDAADPCCKDKMARTHDALRSIGPSERHTPLRVLCIIGACDQFMA